MSPSPSKSPSKPSSTSASPVRRRGVMVGSLVAAGLMAALVPVGAGAETTVPTVLVPIGSDYQAATLELFGATAEQVAIARGDATVDLLVLPITYGIDALVTSKSERKKNLTLAESRRAQIEAACDAVATLECTARLVPALVRADAEDPANVAMFTDTVDGMFTLGGDQTVAMQVVANTPMEARMAALHAAGTIFGGNSAGDAVQSLTMINGYVGDNGAPQGLHDGAVDVWDWDGSPTDATRGLIFGMRDVIAEQHVFERGRLGRAINVSVTQGMPVLGMDQATGGVLVDETTLDRISGATGGLVIDPAGASAPTFGGPNASLSVRDVVTHVLPGGSSFSFATMRPDGDPVGPLPTAPYSITRTGTGTLVLAGGIAAAPGTVGQEFVTAAGGASASIVVLALGYPRATDAQADAKRIAAALQPGVTQTVRPIVIDAKTNAATTIAAIQGATGIVVTAPDPSRVMAAAGAAPSIVTAVRNRWTAGATVLADDAFAAAVGARLSADAPYTDIEADASADFSVGGVNVVAGLGWIGASVTPRLVVDYRWGQAYRVLAADAGRPSLGIDVGTAVVVSNAGTRVIGEEGVVVLDGRAASFGTGTNGGLRAIDVVVDVYHAGQNLS